MSEQPRRIQLSRAKGWRMPSNTVKVDRSTAWGNPFRIGEGGIKTSAEAVELLRYVLAGYLPLARRLDIADMRRYRAFAAAEIGSLRGKSLACWCRKGQPCHADVLLKIANAPEAEGQ